jgi:hypothetical protein
MGGGRVHRAPVEGPFILNILNIAKLAECARVRVRTWRVAAGRRPDAA